MKLNKTGLKSKDRKKDEFLFPLFFVGAFYGELCRNNNLMLLWQFVELFFENN